MVFYINIPVLPHIVANVENRFTICHDYRKEKYSVDTVHAFLFVRKKRTNISSSIDNLHSDLTNLTDLIKLECILNSYIDAYPYMKHILHIRKYTETYFIQMHFYPADTHQTDSLPSTSFSFDVCRLFLVNSSNRVVTVFGNNTITQGMVH